MSCEPDLFAAPDGVCPAGVTPVWSAAADLCLLVAEPLVPEPCVVFSEDCLLVALLSLSAVPPMVGDAVAVRLLSGRLLPDVLLAVEAVLLADVLAAELLLAG